jgi:NAD(P)-dependent dehydrogenase (short-subunit alcohol dehydrogenase family)
VLVTGSAKGIDAVGYRAPADNSNAMAQALARTVAAKCIRVNAIPPGLIDVPIPRFSRASADAEKAASPVPLGRLWP